MYAVAEATRTPCRVPRTIRAAMAHASNVAALELSSGRVLPIDVALPGPVMAAIQATAASQPGYER